MSAATDIAEAVRLRCDVDHVHPFRPPQLRPRSAFVAPADEWKQIDDGVDLDAHSVQLDVFLIAAAGNLEHAYDWLDDQSTKLLAGHGIDVPGDTVYPVEVEAPFVFSSSDGTTLMACRVGYTRFRPLGSVVDA